MATDAAENSKEIRYVACGKLGDLGAGLVGSFHLFHLFPLEVLAVLLVSQSPSINRAQIFTELLDNGVTENILVFFFAINVGYFDFGNDRLFLLALVKKESNLDHNSAYYRTRK